MKKSIYEMLGVTPEAVAALREKIPEIKRTNELLAKIKDETISPEERAEFDELTKYGRELDPKILKG